MISVLPKFLFFDGAGQFRTFFVNTFHLWQMPASFVHSLSLLLTFDEANFLLFLVNLISFFKKEFWSKWLKKKTAVVFFELCSAQFKHTITNWTFQSPLTSLSCRLWEFERPSVCTDIFFQFEANSIYW